MARYRYVGPAGILAAVHPRSAGEAIRTAADCERWINHRSEAELSEPFTCVVDPAGWPRLAPRRSEHVACAGGGPVLGAGEIAFTRRDSRRTFPPPRPRHIERADRVHHRVPVPAAPAEAGSAGAGSAGAVGAGVVWAGVVREISNQSTGCCPDPRSWAAIAEALDRIGIGRPEGFTHEITFRRCAGCRETNIVREGDFVCVFCGEALPASRNIG
ncbi:hypothetical protein [Streptomyces albipurpureus]|uniref:Zinc ribbon domain-containing protein n=1 Tax=Streptomyces albipurpureus TaxID=2897419 RepID=A0ABT0V089_9ACTN|nr:hypothetical protein [Streptomyces sp. CWNU-1]MCM2393310.1 hypothetical protein [Streptomyces sp. CWNU-1]